MKKQKFLSLVCLGLLFASLFVGLLNVQVNGQGTITMYEQSTGSSQIGQVKRNHTSVDAYLSAAGGIINISQTGYLTSVNFRIGIANPSYLYANSLAYCFVTNITGDDGDYTAVPDQGAVLAVSDAFDIKATIDATDWYTFTFDQTVQLEAGDTVAVYFMTSPLYTLGTTQFYLLPYAGSPAGANNYVVSAHNGGWNVPATHYKVMVQVYGMATPAATPTPTPTLPPGETPTPSPTPISPVSTVTSQLLPILVPLIIILVCAAICWYMAGAWGFFAGVNVGVILVYVLVPAYMPLWGVVAIVVVDACLLFGKIGFGSR